MKTVGIIAEYNPFHSGHAYQIRKARELSGADYAAVVMSPDFVQRGSAAILDKWTRACMALHEGADLVLELPVSFATASAEYFALGGVSLLSSLGCVDFLSFGCEANDLSLLEEAAAFFAKIRGNEPDGYRKLLQEKMREGMTYPRARMEAYLEFTHAEYSGSAADSAPKGGQSLSSASRVLSQPNNILALEYQKAIILTGSRLQPVPVKRLGEGYHGPGRSACSTENAGQRFVSAESIRKTLSEDAPLPDAAMPEFPARLLDQAKARNSLIFDDDLSSCLQFRLAELACQEKEADLTEYLDVTGDLANRICNNLDQYRSFSQFVSLIKTRQMTETRIRRSLLHILLDIRSDDPGTIGYARLLGFRRSAGPLMKAIREKSSIPLVANVPDAMHISARGGGCLLDESGRAMLKQTLYSSRIYDMVLQSKTGRLPVSEYRRQPVIL